MPDLQPLALELPAETAVSVIPVSHASLRGPEDLTEDLALVYTRQQNISPRRVPADPPRYWVILVADGQRRSRLWGAFENRPCIRGDLHYN